MKKVVMAFMVLSVLLIGTVGFCRMIMNVDAYIYTDSDTGYSYYIKHIDPLYKGARLSSILVLIEAHDRNDKIVNKDIGVFFFHELDGSWRTTKGDVKKGTLAYKILRYSLEVLGERY